MSIDNSSDVTNKVTNFQYDLDIIKDNMEGIAKKLILTNILMSLNKKVIRSCCKFNCYQITRQKERNERISEKSNSCKSNYHAKTTTTVPKSNIVINEWTYIVCEKGDMLVYLLLTHQVITVKNRTPSKMNIFQIYFFYIIQYYEHKIVINHKYHFHNQKGANSNYISNQRISLQFSVLP